MAVDALRKVRRVLLPAAEGAFEGKWFSTPDETASLPPGDLGGLVGFLEVISSGFIGGFRYTFPESLKISLDQEH